jgi:hypothetical protein
MLKQRLLYPERWLHWRKVSGNRPSAKDGGYHMAASVRAYIRHGRGVYTPKRYVTLRDNGLGSGFISQRQHLHSLRAAGLMGTINGGGGYSSIDLSSPTKFTPSRVPSPGLLKSSQRKTAGQQERGKECRSSLWQSAFVNHPCSVCWYNGAAGEPYEMGVS